MLSVQRLRSFLLVVTAGTGLMFVPQTAVGDDAELRNQANDLFGAIKLVNDDAIHTPIARLGRALFWDERISSDGKTSCATCHLAEDYGADRRQFSPTAKGTLTKRNS